MKNSLEKITEEIIREALKGSSVDLRCTQGNICVPIVNRLYRKMKANILFEHIGVDEDWICDGHHRYIASVLADYSIGRKPSLRTSGHSVIDWKSVVFDDGDWDTPAKIAMLNERDAFYNKTTIQYIEDLLK